jgi:hypothetical protein
MITLKKIMDGVMDGEIGSPNEVSYTLLIVMTPGLIIASPIFLLIGLAWCFKYCLKRLFLWIMS